MTTPCVSNGDDVQFVGLVVRTADGKTVALDLERALASIYEFLKQCHLGQDGNPLCPMRLMGRKTKRAVAGRRLSFGGMAGFATGAGRCYGPIEVSPA